VKYYRQALEKAFERLGYFIADNPVKTLIFSLVVVLPFALGLPKTTIDASTEGFLFSDDPAIVQYNAFRDAYGRDEWAILAIGPTDIFMPKTIEKIRKIHERIENETPYLDEVTSLINARDTRGENDALIVEDLFETTPTTNDEWEVLKKRALSNEFYKNLLLSEDGQWTTIVVSTLAVVSQNSGDLLDSFDAADNANSERQYLTDAQNSEVVNKLRQIAKEENSAELPIIIAGSPVTIDALKRSMETDIKTFICFVVAIIAVTLFIMFRRISGVIYPLLVSILSLLCAVGLMAFCGVSIKLPSQVLPSLLLAVGVGAAVHLIAIFYHEIDNGATKRDAIASTLKHSGLAIAMTALTTISGIGSFAAAEMAPIADVGIYGAFGVFMSLFLTVIFLPALLILAPIKARAERRLPIMDRMLIKIADFSIGNAKIIVIFFGLLTIIAIGAITQLKLSYYPLKWFPKNSEIRQASVLLDDVMRGTVSAEVIIDFGETNALYDPARLEAINNALKEAQTFQGEGYFVGKAFGISEIIKEINRALNENREEFYAIPDNRDLIAQELLLFSNSGSDDLEETTNALFSQARLSHKTPFTDAVQLKPLLDRLLAHYKAAFSDADITVTGLVPMLIEVMNAIVTSMARSYVIAVLVITAMMIILLADIKLGILSMAPNLAPILMGMALMVALDIPFDMFMMLVGSIIIGLAVDDTIHFMHNFRRYYNESGDTQIAVRDTFLTTGRAMCVTTVVMSLSFFVYMFATMSNIVNFGLISGVCIILALCADLILSPALMALIYKSKKKETM
jgi:predicted RND superfamily exporter protein